MPKEIVWSPSAEYDVLAIIDYLIENWGENVALKFVETLDNLILSIAENPHLFPVFQQSYIIRKCVISKQSTLYYRERGDYIDILRVFDSRQHPQKLKF